MRLLWFVLLFLFGCEEIGAYTCDEYCVGVSDKAAECAAEQGVSFAEFAGASEADLIDACQGQVDGLAKTDAQCVTETTAINNSSCARIAEIIGGM